jgi:hypothetical protein
MSPGPTVMYSSSACGDWNTNWPLIGVSSVSPNKAPAISIEYRFLAYSAPKGCYPGPNCCVSGNSGSSSL